MSLWYRDFLAKFICLRMNFKGMTLIEIVIAMLILSITAGMLGGVSMTVIRVNVRTEELIIVNGLAHEVIEEAKATPFGTPIILKPLPVEFTKFKRSVKTEFVNKDNFNKKSSVETDFMRITATVSAPDIQDVVFTTVTNKSISPVIPAGE